MTSKYEHVKFDTIYKGKVVQRIDPARLGRVKVRVFGVHSDDLSVDELPWAWPTAPCGYQCGIWWIPPLDSWVRVRFENHDPEYPVWEGGWWSVESPEFGKNETASAKGNSQHWRHPTSFFGSQEKYPDNTLLKTDKVKGVDPNDAPNNYVFLTPNQKRLELDERLGRHKIALSDFWGNILFINSENAVSTLEVGTGNRTIDSQKKQIDKQRGITISSDSVNKIEQIQVYTFEGWRMTWDDLAAIWETTSPDGHMIRINAALQRIEVWTRGGNKLILDDASERIDLSTIDDRKLVLDDKNLTCALIGQNDDYHILIDENRKFVEIASGGALHLKAAGKINVTSGGIINLDGSKIHLNSGLADGTNLLRRTSPYTKPERLRLTPRAWEYKYYEDPEKTQKA